MSRLSFACRHRFPDGFELDLAFETSAPVTALFGPSGSGKTTVLMLIAGMLSAQDAHIALDETTLCDTRQGRVVPLSMRRIGCVFQDYLLFPHLTVASNLRYGLRRRGHDPRAINYERAIQVLELDRLLDRYPHTLSGGEAQRAALGRAILSGAQLLLLDEPLAALDAALKTRILAYLERVIDEWNIPTLFVTHGQAEVRRLAQYVVVLESGRKLTEGTPDEALGQPDTLSLRNGAGPANLLRISQRSVESGSVLGRVGEQTLHLPPGIETGTEPVYLQFWPHDVTLAQHDVSGLSVRNHLRGVVRQVIPVEGRTFVAIDVGQIIWAEITPQAAEELDLAIGREMLCLIKTQSLRPVE